MMKVIGLGEIMMRLSNPVDSSLMRADELTIYFGGGEYNTLVNLSGLGHETEIITSLPKNALSDRILAEASMYGVGSHHVKLTKGRLGLYYAILGDAVTATNVIYDRANSSFANSKLGDYDFESYFKTADVFHVSGITAALTGETRAMSLASIKTAKQMGLRVSYDSNYRSKLWSQAQAGNFLAEVLPHVDVAFLGILDMQFLLNMAVTDLEEGYAALMEKYPNLQYLASTTRTIISPFHHLLSVNLYDGALYTTDEIDVSVSDRVGTGDVFIAGILDGILLRKEKEEIASFALADAVIKHARYGDNCFVTRDEVEAVQKGDSLGIDR